MMTPPPTGAAAGAPMRGPLGQVFLGNTVYDWLLALIVGLVVLGLLFLLQRVLVSRLAKIAPKTETGLDDFLLGIVSSTGLPFVLAVAIFAGGQQLVLSDRAAFYLRALLVVGVAVQALVWSNRVVQYGVTVGFRRWRINRGDIPTDEGTIAATSGALKFLLLVAAYALVILLALDNLGIDVTALIAGLGVGGIAVALAMQNILGDLFGSLSIVLDKPFVIGDFIVVGDKLGTVERIGLKTTRVRALSGEQLVFSNSDLLSSRIQNFKRMAERRVLFALGVVYGTPRELVAAMPGMLKESVLAAPNVRFDRAHFKRFADFSLEFEVVYYVLSADFNVYMDTQQTINLEIMRRFEEKGIEFAFPTQTLHIAGRGDGAAEAQRDEGTERQRDKGTATA